MERKRATWKIWGYASLGEKMVAGIKTKTTRWLQNIFFEFWYDCQIREIPSKDPPRSGVGLEEGASFVSLSLLYPIGFSIRYTVHVVVVD